jgi:hypothetical protein
MITEISIKIYPPNMKPVIYSTETTTRRMHRDAKKMLRRVSVIKYQLTKKSFGNAGVQPEGAANGTPGAVKVVAGFAGLPFTQSLSPQH